MKALLKKSCPDCTDSTISTYFHTIRSLAKLAEVNGVPLNHQWITDELLRKVKAVPKKTTSKNMAVAALKADHYDGFIVIETHLKQRPEGRPTIAGLSEQEANSRHNLDYIRTLLY